MRKIITLLSVSLITLLLVSCGGGKDYRNMLPADAVAVMSLKPKTIAHKAQIGDFTQSDLYKLIEAKMIKNDELSPEAREYILSLIAEPSKSGLSMDHDAFIFVTGKQLLYGIPEISVLLKVKERKVVDQFTDFLVEQTAMVKIEEDGITFLKYDRSYTSELIAYNDDALIIFNSSNTYEKSMPMLKQLFAQKKEESIMNNPQIVATLDGNNDMNAIVSYGSLTPLLQQFGMGEVFGWMGKMRIAMAGNFEKGEIVSETKIFFDDESAEKQYLALADGQPKSTGKLVKYLPAGSILTVGSGMNGAKLYETLTKIPLYGMAMAMYPQVQTIMDTLEGDMLLSFNTMSHDSKYPLATIIANVNDENISTTLRDLAATAGQKFVETAPGHFVGNLDGIQVWMGCKDDILYITTDNGTLGLLANGEGESMNDRFAHLFTDTYGGIVMDLVPLNAMLRQYMTTAELNFYPLDVICQLLATTDNVQLWSNTLTEVKSVAVMVDQEKNSAEVMFNAIENLIVTLKGHDHHQGCCH